MSEDDKFELTLKSLSELLDARDEKTRQAITLFIGGIAEAVKDYPQGEIHDFLAKHAATYAAALHFAEVIRITDPRDFFERCGFDTETVEFMLDGFAVAIELGKRMKLRSPFEKER